jgi:hypothetical protein
MTLQRGKDIQAYDGTDSDDPVAIQVHSRVELLCAGCTVALLAN